MSYWTVTDTATGASASFQVNAGETEVHRERPTGVFYSLRGGSPKVSYGPLRTASITTPEWIVMGNASYSSIMGILTGGNRMRITDDAGNVWYVMLNGDVKAKLQDTPDRQAYGRWFLTPTFIGVD